MNGHQHYAAGEEALESAMSEAQEELVVGENSDGKRRRGLARMWAEIASAHFLAAAAAPALAGRYGDPARDPAKEELAAEAERAALRQPVKPAEPDALERERWT